MSRRQRIVIAAVIAGLGLMRASGLLRRPAESKASIRMDAPFAMVEGCRVGSLAGIHRGYAVYARPGYQAFVINVSAENIPQVFLRLAKLLKGKAYFTIEAPCNRQTEERLRKKPADPLHKDVYYLDGLTPQEACAVYQKYQHLLTEDGTVNFGIGTHGRNDEVFVGAYKIFNIYTLEPDKYRAALSEMGFHEEAKLHTVWDNFGPATPGERRELGGAKTIWDMIGELKQRGLRLAERRKG